MKILLTAFEPFGGDSVNPAWEAVRTLEAPDGAELVRLQVPTVYGLAGDTVLDAVRRERPDAVLCVGQAAGRAALTPERIAINCRDARIPDNAGQQPADETILPDGPAAYFSTLPIRAMTEAIRAADVPAAVSNTAGTFVCNDLMYTLLHGLEREFPAVRVGFIHVPCLPEQAARQEKPTPSLPLTDIVRGLEAALAVLASKAFN